MKYIFTAILLVSMAMGAWGTATFTEITADGEFSSVETGEYTPSDPEPVFDPSEVLWHYTLETGAQHKVCPIGNGGEYVFTGGWYGGAAMFQGAAGTGVIDWTHEPQSSWTSLGTVTAAAKTADIYYAVQNWDDGKGANTAVHCFNGSSATPLWSWNGTGAFDCGSVSEPGKAACSDDGSVLAVGGAINGHLAVQFFCPDSAAPMATYEDPALAFYPRQLRITADGSACIFRVSATLYRVNTATGELVASFALDASNDCFGVSPDGSVVAYGFTAARIAVWDGTQYNLEAGMSVSGYYGGAAAVAADNSTVYFGFYRNTYRTNRVIRYDLDSSAPAWTWDSPAGTGAYQDVVQWMECTPDGRYMVMGSWGCETGGGAEVSVFDDLSRGEPVFSIDTPGSVFHVDITDDGQYITSAGKHVHANEMGSGTDVYMATIEVTGMEGENHGGPVLSVSPNPSPGAFSASFTPEATGSATLRVYDLGGRLVHSSVESVTADTPTSMKVSRALPAGLYSCVLSSEGSFASSRLVITE